jgi:hypothetical protein
MMKNRVPERHHQAARHDSVFFELEVEAGHGNGTSGEI